MEHCQFRLCETDDISQFAVFRESILSASRVFEELECNMMNMMDRNDSNDQAMVRMQADKNVLS